MTTEQKESEQWLKYVTAVKQRDQARFAAEDAEKKRREHWRMYYALEKVIKEMNAELGLDDVAETITPEKKMVKGFTPGAPKKKRKQAEINLTQDD